MYLVELLKTKLGKSSKKKERDFWECEKYGEKVYRRVNFEPRNDGGEKKA